MNRILPALVFAIMILALWQVSVLGLSIPEYLLPTPVAIISRLIESLSQTKTHLFVTGAEALGGFLLGSIVGIGLASLFVHSKIAELALYPYTIALKSVPIVAIAPLLVVWCGNGMLPKIIIAAIISFFPVVVNTAKGMKSVDLEALDLFESFSATRFQVFMKLRIPNSIPYLFASLKISSTLSVIGAIVGEFSGADKGLGFYIQISSHRLETTDMFVGVVLCSILSVSMFYSIVFTERWLVSWYSPVQIESI